MERLQGRLSINLSSRRSVTTAAIYKILDCFVYTRNDKFLSSRIASRDPIVLSLPWMALRNTSPPY